ncbi:hypothetical protein ACFX13_026607 [Malus domestica]
MLTTFCKMTNLRKLYLCENYVFGEMPEEIRNLASLEELFLCSNNLTGVIPTSISKLICVDLTMKFERNAGTYIDKKCSFTGNVSIRGRILAGTCHSAKTNKTIIVRRNYLHYIKKYQRPLSKSKRFNLLKVTPAGSSGTGRKAFAGI